MYLPKMIPCIVSDNKANNLVLLAIIYTTTAVKKDTDNKILYFSRCSADFILFSFFFVV